MSYYENRIKALEEKVAEMAKRERMKAIPVEAQLLDRIASLKAEVEQIRKIVDEHLTPIPEHTTVREVERLCTAWSLMSNSLDAQWKRIEQLKAENKRLRKAGDYMADHLAHEFGTCPSIEIWNAAKEGKPSV